MLSTIRSGPMKRAINTYIRSIRPFSCTTQLLGKPMPPRPKLDDADITGTYLKGTGPGGQKIVCMEKDFSPFCFYTLI